MKRTQVDHEARWSKWKESVKDKIPNLSKANSDIILQYLKDMELGVNINSKSVKGFRSPNRLNDLRIKMIFFVNKFKELFDVDDITKVTEEQVFELFNKMQTGALKTSLDKRFKSVETFSKAFKAFWHWWQKSNRKKGIQIEDITQDLDTRQEKPDWVYLTEEEIKQLCNIARFDYKVLFWFLYDSGARPPSEVINIKVSDFSPDFKEVNIREEISKTFGRRIKLMLCSNLIKEFVQIRKLQSDDYVFNINSATANKYIKKLAIKIFGNKTSPAGQKYSELSLYDFRHNSCCYWLPKYKSESALMYRFGWKKSDKIHYYSEQLGMKDTISEEDLLIDVTKTELEKRLTNVEKENQLLKEKINSLQFDMKQISELTEIVKLKVKKIKAVQPIIQTV